MMLIKHLQEKHNQKLQQNKDFYTPSGITVYFKDTIDNEKVDPEKVLAAVESKIPVEFLSEIEMIIIGQFDEFEERDINAFYESGTLYITNIQDDNEDMIDDIIHEIAHSLEQPYGLEIYGDNKVKQEFIDKRMNLHSILWSMGYKAPKSFFLETEFEAEFDDYLFKTVGYDKLNVICSGMFITAYAATSLREYFATGFAEYFLHPDNHSFFQKVSPNLYRKINKIFIN